jgi:hypothetical protein
LVSQFFGSLALWPRFIQARFSGLLDVAEQLLHLTALQIGPELEV